MKGWVIAIIAVVGLIVLSVFGYGCSAMMFRGDCIKAEAGIKAQYSQNQNNYDNMWKRFKEIAAVPEMYANDLKELWSKAMSSRYDKEGNTMFRWIQEQNPSLDPTVYKQLQRALEAGRNSFEGEQKQLLARKQQYEVLINGNRGLFFNMWFNFPRIELEKYDIITSDKTEDVFKSKKDNEVLFSAK